MARIRTIKPEFWTDEVVVQLPFQARLLFIGLWNFADDHGAIEESASRLRMQIFPGDSAIEVDELLDLLVVANLLERFQSDEGRRVIQVRNWTKHQKVDNPGKSRVLDETYRKLAIPSEARRAVALKHGCAPGATKEAVCYFCGLPGQIKWWPRQDGRPGSWVSFSDLELDHLAPEVDGGANSAENLVLSCRACNRGRRDKLALPWILSRALASPIESSPSEKERDQGKGSDTEASPRPPPRKTNGKKPKTALPEGFALDGELRAYAENRLPQVDVAALFESFCGKAQAKCWVYADWRQAWQEFCRNCAPSSGHWAQGQYPKQGANGVRWQ